MTTQFLRVAYLPLFPIISKRISYRCISDYSSYDTDGYFVCELLPLDHRQVLSVYGWFAAVIAPLLIWGSFQDQLTNWAGDEDVAAGLCLLSSAVAFVLPYFLRRWAKHRKAEEWKRQSLGMHGRPL